MGYVRLGCIWVEDRHGVVQLCTIIHYMYSEHLYVVERCMHELHRPCSRNSLSRISALGVDGGASAFSLSLWGKLFPFSGLQDQCNLYTT